MTDKTYVLFDPYSRQYYGKNGDWLTTKYGAMPLKYKEAVKMQRLSAALDIKLEIKE